MVVVQQSVRFVPKIYKMFDKYGGKKRVNAILKNYRPDY